MKRKVTAPDGRPIGVESHTPGLPSLLQSTVNNHALFDGNKRLGWVSTSVFLEPNDASVADASNDDVTSS